MFIVAKGTKEGIRTSAAPRVHAGLEEAIAEAEKIAAKEGPGNEFVVFQAVTISKAKTPPVETTPIKSASKKKHCWKHGDVDECCATCDCEHRVAE